MIQVFCRVWEEKSYVELCPIYSPKRKHGYELALNIENLISNEKSERNYGEPFLFDVAEPVFNKVKEIGVLEFNGVISRYRLN